MKSWKVSERLTDTLTPAARSEQMSSVRGRDTKPELIVRRFPHAAGLRYRLHQKVEGVRPDLVFSSRKLAVLVHGCVWHQHFDPHRKRARMPKSRFEFCRLKLEGNRARDERQRAVLKATGWATIEIWECQIACNQKLEDLANRISAASKTSRR